MNLKKFSICASVIAALIIVLCVVLACVKVNNGFEVTADKFIVYKKTSTGKTIDQTTPANYKKLNKLYNEITNLSVFDYVLDGKSVDMKPSQDIKNKYPNWTDSNKSNYYCLEVIFDEKQSIIVNVDGDTKAIDFYGLILKVEKSSRGAETAIYFSTSTSTSKSYSQNPIIVRAKQNKLLKFLEEV